MLVVIHVAVHNHMTQIMNIQIFNKYHACMTNMFVEIFTISVAFKWTVYRLSQNNQYILVLYEGKGTACIPNQHKMSRIESNKLVLIELAFATKTYFNLLFKIYTLE